MAPELFAGAPADGRSDIYALGVTIYRMFTAAYPYGEIEPFSKPRFLRPPVPLSAHRPDLPAWIGQVLARAVAVRAADRFEDVVEFAFALEHGALQAAVPPPRQSLLERDPVRFWQMLSLTLALILMVLLLRRHGGL
jgi:serine/threonine protein kinase